MLLKRRVIECHLNDSVEVMSRSDCGKLFHALGPATSCRKCPRADECPRPEYIVKTAAADRKTNNI